DQDDAADENGKDRLGKGEIVHFGSAACHLLLQGHDPAFVRTFFRQHELLEGMSFIMKAVRQEHREFPFADQDYREGNRQVKMPDRKNMPFMVIDDMLHDHFPRIEFFFFRMFFRTPRRCCICGLYLGRSLAVASDTHLDKQEHNRHKKSEKPFFSDSSTAIAFQFYPVLNSLQK
ncbi:MAG: hypothetical protein Q8905_17425, partial [Bacteroidota bacterium]|nr:hypothetical protein [Bacteroidota bacterium]